MGLSEKQVTSVQETWKKVSTDLKGHGVKIFVEFLTTNPDQQAFFESFKDVAAADLPTNDDLAKQAVVVMNALEKMIAVIDKPDDKGLKEVVKPIAVSHVARKITLENFQKIFPIIVDYIVKNASGDKEAWTAAMEVIGAEIKAGQEK